MKAAASPTLPIALTIGLFSLSTLLVSCSASADSASAESDDAGIQEILQPQEENPLFSVALYGTDQEFADCLAGTDRMLERDSEGRGVLYYLYECSSESRIACLRALGDAGFPFATVVDDRDAPALQEIVTRSLAEDLAFLRASGVRPGSIGTYREMAVQWLVDGMDRGSADERTLDELLRDGCSISFRDEYGDTALSEACSDGLYPLALRLSRLERKEADLAGMTLEPSYYTKCGKFAVTAERAEAGTASLKPLLAEFVRREMNLQTVLCACCDYGESVQAMKVVLALGADPNAPGESGLLPLFAATEAEKICTLLDHGALIDAPNGDGISALTNACVNGNFEVGSCLLARGAKIRDAGGEPSDVSAAFNSQSYDLCLALLDAGASVNRAFDGQENPLARLARCSESLSSDAIELARRLVAAGYRADEPDSEGNTALYTILLAGDAVPPEAVDVFSGAAGPDAVAATRALIDRERDSELRKDRDDRILRTCALGAFTIVVIVSSLLFREALWGLSAFLGLAFAGILAGGTLGMILDSMDIGPSQGWLRLPVWTILGIPAGCFLGCTLFAVAPLRRLFRRYTALYYYPFIVTIVILCACIKMAWA